MKFYLEIWNFILKSETLWCLQIKRILVYMIALVLLNLSNELRKSDKIGGLPSILLLFCNKYNKFNNTGSQTLDSIYHLTQKLL